MLLQCSVGGSGREERLSLCCCGKLVMPGTFGTKEWTDMYNSQTAHAQAKNKYFISFLAPCALLYISTNNMLPWKLDQRMLPRTTKKNTTTYKPTGRLYKCCCFNEHLPIFIATNVAWLQPIGRLLCYLFPPCLLVVHCKTARLLPPPKNPIYKRRFIWLVDDLW